MALRLNALTWGPGPLRALLLHGITSDAAGWWRLGPDIASHGYEVVAVDLRGHGSSPRGNGYHMTDYVGDLLNLGSWDLVVGHSMGGAIATVAQAEDESWSRRLVLEDPLVVVPDAGRAIEWLTEDLQSLPDAEALARANPAWAPHDAVAKAGALRNTSVEVVEQTFAANDPWDQRQLFGSLGVPTLVIGADPAMGALVPADLGADLAVNPGVEFIQIMASHSMHRDAYAEFWSALLPWVTSET